MIEDDAAWVEVFKINLLLAGDILVLLDLLKNILYQSDTLGLVTEVLISHADQFCDC